MEKSERVPQSPKNIIVLSKLNQNLIDSFEKSETVPVADYLKRRHLKFNLLCNNIVNIWDFSLTGESYVTLERGEETFHRWWWDVSILSLDVFLDSSILISCICLTGSGSVYWLGEARFWWGQDRLKNNIKLYIKLNMLLALVTKQTPLPSFPAWGMSESGVWFCNVWFGLVL